MESNPSSPLAQSQLGRQSAYPDQYDPSLLFPIARATSRSAMGIDPASLPFSGADQWTAFELSWLNQRGKPQVAIAHVTVPCDSPNIIESKSFKLYLNSFNNARFDGADGGLDAVGRHLRHDLAAAAWQDAPAVGTIGLRLVPPGQFAQERIAGLDGICLDDLDVACEHYQPTPSLLHSHDGQAAITETLHSHLLKSNCLVTGQPDWGSVQIHYHGAPIDHAGLLQYLVSFRNHNEFHEPCAERIFIDIWTRCRPQRLSVQARYTRRGGLDINPWRSSWPQPLPDNHRLARQ